MITVTVRAGPHPSNIFGFTVGSLSAARSMLNQLEAAAPGTTGVILPQDWDRSNRWRDE